MGESTRTKRSHDIDLGGGAGLRGRDFVLLLAAMFAAFASFAPLLSVVPLWAVAGGAGEAGAGATTGVFMLVTVLTQVGMPWLARRVSYRAALGAGAVLLGVPALLYPASAEFLPVIVVSALRGVGFGLLTVAGSTLVARLVPPSQRGRGVSLYGLAVGLPNLVFLPGGVWAAQHLGYLPVFVAAGVLPLLALLAALAMNGDRGSRNPGDPAPTEAVRPDTPRRGHGSGRLLLRLAAPWTILVSATLAGGALVTFLPLALARAGTGVAPAALFAFSLAMIAARGGAGVISDRTGSAWLLAPALGAGGLGMAGLAFAVAVERPGLVAVAAVVAASLYGFGFGALQNGTLVVMFGRVGPSGYGTASAAWNVAFDAGTGLGAVAFGLLVESWGYAPGFAVAATLVAACVPVALSVARRPGG
ncbi:MAG: MFS transporter [Streptosporangiales bacterium]|nr:MFS transporter [Streptosporangiales bacterium]